MRFLNFILPVALFNTAFIFSADAHTLYVGKDQHIQTVQQALQLAQNGDTIIVYPGLYREKNIVIKKPVYLKGIGFPIVDGERKYEIFNVQSSNVTIEGFKLVNSGISDVYEIAAVKIINAKNVIVRNNKIENNFFGIYAQYSRQCSFIGNIIHSDSKISYQTGNAIHCFKCDSMMISFNSVSGHRDGIYFEFVTHSLIRQNISEKNMRYGLHFMTSHFNTYIADTFRNNGAGVAVMYTHNVRMLNNVFEMNTGDASYGLLLKEITDSYIHGNKFIKNTAAIYMESGTRLQISDNTFSNNGWAIRIEASCVDDTITHNNFLGNTFDVSTNGTLVLNNFDHNYWDKYEGYDLNKDKTGDIPYRPVSLYSMIAEKNPSAMMLFRSFMVTLFDKTEKILPGIIPENLKDNAPLMKPVSL
jgi:nitrous oxidase accessory protein